MNKINYISSSIIPLVILGIVGYGLFEKNKVYETFIDGAREGINIVINIFPTLVGIFLAVGALRSSGILDLIIKLVEPITNFFNIPSPIMPLAFLRPISGSASMGVATDIIKNYGVNSKIGRIASCIMGSTETTLYTIAVYTGCIKVKKIRFVFISALIADIVGIVASVIICQNMS